MNLTGIFNNTIQCTFTTSWGYTNNGPAVYIPIGIFDYFINIFNNIIVEGQTTYFLGFGTFVNQFTSTIPCSYQQTTWGISYGGFNASATSTNFTTCESYCCNSTYCYTTPDYTCSMITSGTITWGGWGTNCTNGQPITDTLPFPCPCTAKTNNGAGCGILGNLNFTYCTLDNDNGINCIFSLTIYNNNTETLYIQSGGNDNYLNTTISGGTLTTTILSGLNFRSENLTYNCNPINRFIRINQTFANY